MMQMCCHRFDLTNLYCSFLSLNIMQYDVIWCDAIRYDTVTKHHILFSLFMIFFRFLINAVLLTQMISDL